MSERRFVCGGVLERFKRTVLKTVDPRGSVSSNLTPSADESRSLLRRADCELAQQSAAPSGAEDPSRGLQTIAETRAREGHLQAGAADDGRHGSPRGQSETIKLLSRIDKRTVLKTVDPQGVRCESASIARAASAAQGSARHSDTCRAEREFSRRWRDPALVEIYI